MTQINPPQVDNTGDSHKQLHAEDEISLADIAKALGARKGLIIAVTSLATVLAIVAALLMTPMFRAEVLLTPAEDDGGKGGAAAQLGGLAALAGVNIGGGGSGRDEAIATLGSRALISNYIQSNNLLIELFYKDWDAEAGKWDLGYGADAPPTLWMATNTFKDDVISVKDDKKTGLVTLSVEWRDPVLAAKWANEMVKLVNVTLRDRATEASTRRLAYLSEQLDKTSIVELRQAIFNLMESEVKNVMIAKGNEEYAFRVIDPAVVPEKKSKPKRALIVVMGMLLGLFLSCFYALIAESRKASLALQR